MDQIALAKKRCFSDSICHGLLAKKKDFLIVGLTFFVSNDIASAIGFTVFVKCYLFVTLYSILQATVSSQGHKVAKNTSCTHFSGVAP